MLPKFQGVQGRHREQRSGSERVQTLVDQGAVRGGVESKQPRRAARVGVVTREQLVTQGTRGHVPQPTPHVHYLAKTVTFFKFAQIDVGLKTARAHGRHPAPLLATMSNLCLYSAFDASALQFSAPDKNKMGGQTVGVFVPGPDGSRKRVTIQTPAVVVPFGLSAYTDKNTGEIQSYSIDISFKNADNDPRLADFLARMRSLDSTLLAAAATHEWFGPKKSPEIIKEFMRELVQDKKLDRTGKPYPPQMKTKVGSVCSSVVQCVLVVSCCMRVTYRN